MGAMGQAPQQWDRPPSNAPRWVEPFLDRTVVFIGCGLSLDEWPLWWMIRQRALSRGNRRATYHVGAGPALAGTQEHAFRQYGIQAIRFGSFEEMWGAVREAIA